ncbi:Aste57867_17670 [Aphanomyces stellatus]|uniref:RING-type E3 ubiquitin transferase n=1 Tax=Aphanomyces stellatus TaxID=120398 RepID=A0A485LA33_9STRA|nr:hypothetical protein As57867_017609 [Aphanomyces stellatus]VFT94421.1 Aste57867_17670 [Aphanomyces stellatus]
MPCVHLDREDVLCAICLDVLTAPITFPCGHSFDKHCFNQYIHTIARATILCPTCRAVLTLPLGHRFAINRWMESVVQRAFPEEFHRAKADHAHMETLASPPPTKTAPLVSKVSGFVIVSLVLAFSAALVALLHCPLNASPSTTSLWDIPLDGTEGFFKLGALVVLVNSLWNVYHRLTTLEVLVPY